MLRLIVGLFAYCSLIIGIASVTDRAMPALNQIAQPIVVFGSEYATAFGVMPENTTLFWFLSFLASATLFGFLTLVTNYVSRTNAMRESVRETAQHILEQEFTGASANSLGELASNIAERYSPHRTGRQESGRFLHNLIDSLRQVDHDLAPLDELRKQIAETRRAGAAAMERLDQIETEEDHLNAALAELEAEFRPGLDRAQSIILHLADLKRLEEELATLETAIGEGGAEGVIARIHALRQRLRELGRHSKTLFDNPLGDGDSLDDVIYTFGQRLEDVRSEEDFRDALRELSELEEDAQKIETLVGQPEFLIKRIQHLSDQVERLQGIDEQIWYPLGDSEHLEDVLMRLRNGIEDLDQSSLDDQVDEIKSIEEEIRQIVTTITQAAARLNERLSEAS